MKDKRTDKDSQHSIVNTVKDWLMPDAIKQVKKNQAKVKASEGVKEIKK